MESIERAAWNFIPPAERANRECPTYSRVPANVLTIEAVEHPRSRRRMERDRREGEGEGAVTGHHDADAGERRRKEGGREGRVKAAA